MTATGYLLTALLLFWPGWKLTGKIDRESIRICLRAGLVALAFAPAVLMTPGGEKPVVPASLAAIVSVILYTVSEPAVDFYFYHALISIFLVWLLGFIVGRVSMKLR